MYKNLFQKIVPSITSVKHVHECAVQGCGLLSLLVDTWQKEGQKHEDMGRATVGREGQMWEEKGED